MPLRKKYKIIRKVKEHEKKKTKEAKKLGINKRPKVEKDPGIPNDWPFKEQELKALEVRRQRAIDDLEAKKAARKERVCDYLPFSFYLIQSMHSLCSNHNANCFPDKIYILFTLAI